MLRDHNQTEAYFNNYLNEQEKRIQRFSKKLEQMVREQRPEEKVRQCHGILARLLHDKLYAQYSLGCPKEDLSATVSLYLDHVKEQNQLTFQETAEALSLAIVFHRPAQKVLSADRILDDDLLKTLYFWDDRHKTCQESYGLLFPGTARVFWQALEGKTSGSELSRYIQTHWYEDNYDASWFNAAQRNDGTYCGYWCFLGAAVALLMKFDKKLFADCHYFPLDVLEW